MTALIAEGFDDGGLWQVPESDRIYELIDGHLYVTPTPVLRHQETVALVVGAMHPGSGRRAFAGPIEMVLATDTLVRPDLVILSDEQAGQVVDARIIDVRPDVVVEVSSPTTRRMDLVWKRNLYERAGIPEYWFVDLEVLRVDVHRLDGSGHYGLPTTYPR